MGCKYYHMISYILCFTRQVRDIYISAQLQSLQI